MTKKYEFTGATKDHYGVTLKQIRALVKFFKRCAAWYVMRSLEIQLHGQNQAMRDCLDAQTREHIAVSRTYTRKELAKARADYIALLPPGQLRTFKTA